MESGGKSPRALGPVATLGGADAGPDCSSLDLPSTDPGKLQALPIKPGAHSEEHTLGIPGGQTPVQDGSSDRGSVGAPSFDAKNPNRDSGIDSPSCCLPSEPFPNKEGSEAGLGPSILGLHPEMAPDSKTTREEADSEVGEDSSEEPEPENSSTGARVDLDPAKVGYPAALGQRGSLWGRGMAEACSASRLVPAQTPCLERPLH